MSRYPILLFAGLRDAAKQDTIEVELPEVATVRDLLVAVALAYPDLAPRLGPCRVAIDHAFVENDDPLPPAGTEIALIPPVSGGHSGIPPALLTHAPLQLDALIALVHHDGAGGLATFSGSVRQHSRGLKIDRLEYEAYGPMAQRGLEAIIARLESQTPGVRVAIHHRLGVLVVGECAVVIAASAPHRAEAFDACRAAIEALKHDVPIWKKEVSVEGEVWIGQGP